ncbi:ATP-binding protein [Agaribacterium haliotis]|uniref:ATP-binding protein n=1 Tax=Agaribacterium haliotis TaxID=2013869 RepID=UPI000BB5972A|nr:ATP-binding protein [Agaribacterium haliotis]
MSLVKRVRRSVSLKLALPVIGASFLVGVIALTYVLLSSEREARARAQVDVKLIVSSLILVGEVDAAESSLKRAIFSLATEENIRSLALINADTATIIASNKPEQITKHYSGLHRGLVKKYAESKLINGAADQYSWLHDKHFSVIRRMHLLDQTSNRVRPFIVYVDYDLSALLFDIRNKNLVLACILVAGLLTVSIALFMAQARVVLRPLNTVVKALKKGQKTELIQRLGTDEIGLLAQAYNDFILSSRAREETLRLQAIELELAIDAADEANRAKSEFLASMSHEIRTPMNGVIGMLSLLERAQLSADQQHKFRLAKSSAESLLSLINDILDFSKIEAGKLELDAVDFDLSLMLGELGEMMALRAEEKGLELNLDLVGLDAQLVNGDAGRVRQVFTNLIGNAIKFTHSGHIDVKAGLIELDDEYIRLQATISDTGIGIPEHKQAGLFEAFTQEDASTTRKYGGTGLGLAICRRLCQLMHGEISLESQAAKGSSFGFSLRLQKSAGSQRLMPKGNCDALKLIIFTQSERLAKTLAEQFQHWRIDCTIASDFDEVLEQLHVWKAFEHCAIFVDYRCEQRLQFAFVRLLRSSLAQSQAKIIFMRAMSEQPDPLLYVRRGYFHSFPLPATKQDLLLSLELLNSSARSMQCYDLAVHTETLELKKRKLLLVEDNAINQEVALGLMEDMAVEVECVDNGAEALELLKHKGDGAFEIVLMDCQMPVMDGFECARRIRDGAAGEAYKTIAIIALTANAMQGDRERCLAAGMNDYLSKPIDSTELERAIYRWSESPKINASVAASTPEDRSPSATGQTQEGPGNGVADIEDWREHEMLSRVRGKPERVRRLAERFLHDMPLTLCALEQACSIQDCDEAQKQAHAVKGVAANMSAQALRTAAEQAERAAKAADLVKLDSAVQQAKLAMQRLEPILRAYIDKAEHEAAGTAESAAKSKSDMDTSSEFRQNA